MMRNLRYILFVFCLMLASVYAFAQDQYAWRQLTSLPAVGRHRACGCSIGNRGYIGLGHINNWNNSINYDDWWEYDPGTDSWMQKANYPMGGRYHAIAFSIGNYAYVGTGSDWNGDHDDMWRYSPATNLWSPIPPVPGGPRSGAVALTANGKGYVMLGDFQNDIWEYDPSTNAWSARPSSPVTGYSSVGAVYNGKIYVGVGSGTSWAEYNPANGQWTMKATFPGLSRFGSGCFEYNGWIYVVSGSDWSQEFPDSYAYNPQTDQWVQVSDFPGQGRHYFTCFSIGNHAYGGTGTSGTNFNDFWEYGNISGVEETSPAESNVKIFPDPVIDRAQFEFSKTLEHPAEFILTDAQGKKIRDEIIPAGNSWMFERKEELPGACFYSITSDHAVIASGKIILQ
jgi:N-acetylneuraminic acid mutarotase